MTVSDDAEVRRPRLTAQERARLAAEAWRLKDREGMSTRQIAERFTAAGTEISHVQVWRLIKEAQEQEQFLDLVGPAMIRAGQIGRFDTYIEKILAAIETGGVPFDKGMSQIIALESLLAKVGGSLAAQEVKHTGDAAPASPNMALLEELRKAKDHARRMAEMEENDGLG